MPLIATWVIFNSGGYISFVTGEKIQRFIYIVVFISTYLLPATTSWAMWKTGWINSLEMETRKERNLPFLASLVCYLAGAYLLFTLPVPRIFAMMITGAAIAILWCFLINLFWKISIHMVGIGGVMGILFAYGYYFRAEVLISLIILSLLAGLLGSARLYKGAHIPSQVYLGFIGGFSIEFFFFKSVMIAMHK
jgi:hypothetical protein